MRSETRREEHFVPHIGDKGVAQLEGYFKDLFALRNEIGKNFGRITNKNFTSSGDKLVGKIVECVRKRFGFGIEIRFTNTPLAVRVIDPKNSAGLRDTQVLTDEAKKAMKNIDPSNNPMDIKKLLDDIDSLDVHLHKAPLKVNMDALYIEGLPASFKPTVYLNAAEFTKPELYITPRELLAGFLHELGHVFTYIVFSYRLRNKKMMLERATKAWYKKGKKDEEAFMLAYEEVFKKKNEDRSNVKQLDVLRDIANDINDQLYFTDKKDKEFIADAFVACFGYSADMISLVGKLGGYKTYGMMVSDIQYGVWQVAGTYILLFYLTGVYFALCGAKTAIIWGVVGAWIWLIIQIALIAIFVQAMLLINDESFKEYGDIINRCERQRRNCVVLINRIMEDKGDEDVIKMLVDQVNFIEREIDHIEGLQNRNLTASLCNWLMGWNNKFIKTKEFSEFKENVEDLLHNDLALSKAKLLLATKR